MGKLVGIQLVIISVYRTYNEGLTRTCIAVNKQLYHTALTPRQGRPYS